MISSCCRRRYGLQLWDPRMVRFSTSNCSWSAAAVGFREGTNRVSSLIREFRMRLISPSACIVSRTELTLFTSACRALGAPCASESHPQLLRGPTLAPVLCDASSGADGCGAPGDHFGRPGGLDRSSGLLGFGPTAGGGRQGCGRRSSRRIQDGLLESDGARRRCVD